jgi:hypothetical protein
MSEMTAPTATIAPARKKTLRTPTTSPAIPAKAIDRTVAADIAAFRTDMIRPRSASTTFVWRQRHDRRLERRDEPAHEEHQQQDLARSP